MAEGAGNKGGGESLDQVRQERDQLVRNEKTYQQRIRQLEEEVQSVVSQSQQLSTENGELRDKLEALEGSGPQGPGGSRQAEEQLKREIQELTAMVAKTTGEKQQLEFDNESLQSRLSLLEGHKGQSASTDSQKAKVKQEELEKRIQELEKDQQALENDKQALENAKQALENDKKALENDKQALERENQGLDRDKQELQDKLNKAQTEILASLQNGNTQSESEVTNLQTKIKTLERTVKNLEAENKELVERMEQKRSELEELMRAMQTEAKGDKDTSQDLEFANRKIDDLKKELNEVKRRNETLEKENDSTKSMLRLKESESKSVKADSEEKDTQLAQLNRQVESLKRNVKRLEKDLEDAKPLEKDTASMKARIRSLKTEIEDSLNANQRMKEERAEAKLQAERVNRELATTSVALTESRRLLKKLEGDRDSRGKLEQELTLCKERAAGLERSAREMTARKEQWKKKMEEEIKGRKVRELELEGVLNDLKIKNQQLKRKIGVTEKNQESSVHDHDVLRDLNKKLDEENKKLRQTVAERNMEITQHQSERSMMVKRMDSLLRQQMDPRMRQQQQQQLKGWVDNAEDMYASVPAPSQYSIHPEHVLGRPPPGPSSSSHPPRQSRREGPPTNPHPGRNEGSYTQLHQSRSEESFTHAHQARNGVAVPTHPSQTGSEDGMRRRKRTLQQDRQNQLNRSWEDMNHIRQEQLRHAEHYESSRTTPGTLPIILDSKILPNSESTGPGYFDLYKNKMKLIRERKW